MLVNRPFISRSGQVGWARRRALQRLFPAFRSSLSSCWPVLERFMFARRPRGDRPAAGTSSFVVPGAVLPAVVAFRATLAGLPALLRLAGKHVAPMAAMVAHGSGGQRGKEEKTESSNNRGADHYVSSPEGPKTACSLACAIAARHVRCAVWRFAELGRTGTK